MSIQDNSLNFWLQFMFKIAKLKSSPISNPKSIFAPLREGGVGGFASGNSPVQSHRTEFMQYH
ncbi:hypothetical protein hrd7_08340 [Leptolinea sp. HRD-7]|nr:hypothetical protein hrd7_08340 [Leptolinea sp. HRD-7]